MGRVCGTQFPVIYTEGVRGQLPFTENPTHQHHFTTSWTIAVGERSLFLLSANTIKLRLRRVAWETLETSEVQRALCTPTLLPPSSLNNLMASWMATGVRGLPDTLQQSLCLDQSHGRNRLQMESFSRPLARLLHKKEP